MLEKVRINKEFSDTIVKKPLSTDHLKNLCLKKEELERVDEVTLGVNCSQLLQRRVAKKRKDLISFSFPCYIGSHCIDRALADLEASINVMPYPLCQRLGLTELVPTSM
ncbi:hypothetical protein LINPERPRIM_LOCUS21853, partial [Linum perenne]